MSRESKNVLAFDFGASSGRAILGTLRNGKIEMKEVHRFSNDPVTIHGTMYWDTLRQFFEIKQGILKAKQELERPGRQFVGTYDEKRSREFPENQRTGKNDGKRSKELSESQRTGKNDEQRSGELPEARRTREYSGKHSGENAGNLAGELAGGRIDSIGIDTWGVDFGLLDRRGMMLENAIHYRDGRTKGMQESVFSKIPRERLYEITGNEFNYFNTIFQLNALLEKRPEVLERTDRVLFTPDLFNYFLTGEKRAEYTMATTSSLLDIRRRAWSEEIMNAVGLDRNMFPELIFSGEVVGELTDEICQELGLDPVKVIAVASHDTQSASAAVPSQKDDFIFLSCGTWSLYGTELPEPVINETSLKYNISNEGGYGGRINFLKNLTGLWMVQESRRQWIREGKNFSFGELETMAQKAEPLQNYVDVNDDRFVPAGNMPQRIREYCAETGQNVPESMGEIVCCINQSLALRYRRELERIESCLGKHYDTIHMIGGGIQSKMLCQMTADACGRRVVAGPVEATALGNIAVQLIALGEIRDLKEARQIIARSEETTIYEPQDTARWDAAYEDYNRVVHGA